MAFHRDYPVRLYQSLVRDLQEREWPTIRERPRAPRQRRSGDVWDDAYRALMRYSLDELKDMAAREGVGKLPRDDSKGMLVKAIIEKRKERLSGKGRG